MLVECHSQIFCKVTAFFCNMPIIEQVCEFYGKRLGDDVGELLYNYGTLYNNAFVVIDCTNGLGDVPLFTLVRKGYKNIFYEY